MQSNSDGRVVIYLLVHLLTVAEDQTSRCLFPRSEVSAPLGLRSTADGAGRGVVYYSLTARRNDCLLWRRRRRLLLLLMVVLVLVAFEAGQTARSKITHHPERNGGHV